MDHMLKIDPRSSKASKKYMSEANS